MRARNVGRQRVLNDRQPFARNSLPVIICEHVDIYKVNIKRMRVVLDLCVKQVTRNRWKSVFFFLSDPSLCSVPIRGSFRTFEIIVPVRPYCARQSAMFPIRNVPNAKKGLRVAVSVTLLALYSLKW